MSFFDPFFGAGHGTRRSQSQSNDDDPIVINIETDGEPPHSNAAGGNGTPRSPRITRKPAKPHGNHGRRVAIAVVVAIAVIVALFFAVSSFAADVMWYSQLGFQSVVWTLLGTRVGLWVFYAALMVLVSYIAATLAIRARPDFADGSTIRINGDTIEIGKSVSSRTARRVAVVISLIAGIIFGSKVNANWTEILLMFHNQSFGSVDPQFGLDNGFYVFVLPGLRMLVSAFTLLMFVALVFSVATHVAMGGIRFTMPVHGHGLFAITKRARRQIGIWLVLWMLSWAVSQGLSVFSSLTAQGDRFTGANYTAVNAGIPVTIIMAVLTAVLGVVLCVWLMTTHVFDDAVSRPTANAAAAWREWRVPTIAVASTLVVGILLSTLWPMLLQRFRVNPNAQEMESAYIQRNIDATRAAYGLDAVKTDEYKATTKAQAGALQKDAETTAQIRLLDPQIVSPTFKQLQQMKQYYTFADTLAVDKYDIDGVNQDTVIAAREINLEGNDNRNWVNDHTVYTHGYGIVAAYGNKVTSDGQPQFFEYGIPTQGYLTDTQHYEPRIYFSPEAPEYSIVGAPQGTKSWEFDYPTGSEGATTTFNGNGGPRIGNIFSRLIYSIKFGSDQILFSDRVNADSQILYDRSPKERVAKVAPYLTLDGRVYPAVVDGRVKWIVDGYTTSSNYPYSQKTDLAEATQDSTTISSQTVQGLTDKEVNYMRNSVKATVDAYDGSVDLYTWDDSDPVLKAWQSIFPGQYHPMSEISGDLMAHMRYPEGMFKVQRQLLAKYHVTSASQFFSGEDFWQTPVDPTESKSEQSRDVLQPPYYLTLQTGGSDEPVFSLTSTYIPAGSSTREILTGFLSVDSDAGRTKGVRGPDYGTIRLQELPKDSNVPGPGQAQNNFNANADVSKELNLLESGSTQVERGNLLTLPLGGGLVYVEPVYVKSSGATSYPLLKKVLVAFGDQVGFANTLNEALNQVFDGNSGAQAGDGGNQGSGGNPSDSGAAGDNADGSGSTANTNRNPELSQALQDAGKAMKDADSAMKKGDWSGYGEAQKRLEEALDKAMALDK
ncbi:UPF0182 family membrane protein [Bifidobacterium animalis]|uniref:UPF0182 protein PG2011B_1047 n=1 Tax=Bifidobacterium animalis subsp. lactis TaxID=302911 RepID=A0A8B3RH75_BIFAN|nr:UPF0182 family protein [Bifidobacterium animalis]RYM94332.1 hypothetical protein PG2011B_1047 [Bifidobacterium animalis subsp. lactis]RYN08614.1 hypothetical protein PG1528B_0975 [Bifidobacterium animalis subsp. lactis]